MRKVLFVCHGNICRSVMAEYIFKSKANVLDYYCESRAVSSEEIGNDIYGPAKRCLDKHGIKYNRHYAKKISQEDYDGFDDIFIMDASNEYYIKRIVNDNKHKIRKLCEYDIEDPWYTGDFETVFNQISKGIEDYLKR